VGERFNFIGFMQTKTAAKICFQHWGGGRNSLNKNIEEGGNDTFAPSTNVV